ncbi:hypothetical protein HOY80DRAFT_997182 [Tuber brumale]|nr:hypothetical protein HOY80DRAFT_997182 [Tuber brumale]
MDVRSDTEEGFQKDELETAGRVSDLENKEVDSTNASIDPMGEQEVSSDKDVHQEAPESAPMILQVAWRRGQGNGIGIGVTTRWRMRTDVEAKKQSRLNQVKVCRELFLHWQNSIKSN